MHGSETVSEPWTCTTNRSGDRLFSGQPVRWAAPTTSTSRRAIATARSAGTPAPPAEWRRTHCRRVSPGGGSSAGSSPADSRPRRLPSAASGEPGPELAPDRGSTADRASRRGPGTSVGAAQGRAQASACNSAPIPVPIPEVSRVAIRVAIRVNTTSIRANTASSGGYTVSTSPDVGARPGSGTKPLGGFEAAVVRAPRAGRPRVTSPVFRPPAVTRAPGNPGGPVPPGVSATVPPAGRGGCRRLPPPSTHTHTSGFIRLPTARDCAQDFT